MFQRVIVRGLGLLDYYNNLGCLHQIMRKPNLAIYYFKNALDSLAHYLDPHVWFHLAEFGMLAHLPENLPQGREREVSQGGAGAGLSYKLVATDPP